MRTWEKILRYPIGLSDGIKKMSKKWKPAMVMLMAVVMLCGMLPMMATAADATKIKVAGTELIETGYYTVSSGSVGSKQDTEPAGGSGYVHWDAANHTLTLHGVTVDGGTTSSGIFANGDYTIKLAEGTNNTVCSGYTNAITCDAGSVTIKGPGTMNATGATNGIKAQYSVVIKANVTVTGNNGCGIVNSPTSFSNNADPVRIADTATVSVTGSTYGIGMEGTYGASPVIDSPNVTIKGGTAAFKAFPHGAPKLSKDIGVWAGENESSLGAYDSASYSTYKCVKTRNLATYTVSFDANGGDGSMGNATAIEGKEYTLPTCTFIAPANKTFKAWSLGSEEKAPGEKITVTADTTVTAVWQDLVKYDLWVDGEEFTSEKLVIDGTDGGTATYDPTTNTVTLNNFKFSGTKGIYSGFPNAENFAILNIILVGENSITAQKNGVASEDDMTIQGSGAEASLTVVSTGGDGYYRRSGISAGGNLTIRDVTLDVTGDYYGIGFQKLVFDEDSVIISKARIALDVRGGDSGVTLAASSVVFAGDDADSAVRVNAPTNDTYANKYVKIMPDYNVSVSFDANSGAGTMDDATVACGKEYTLPECGFTAPAGKQFKAWRVNGSEKQPGDKVVFMEDAAVTAIWKDIPHTCSIEPVEKVWPDCENGGKEAYYKGCGKFFKDANGTTEIANIATWGNLPKNGHTEGTEWKSDKDNHWHICTVAGCGAVIDNSKAAHTPDRAAATETDPVKCSACGYEITAALGHTHAHGTQWKSDEDNHWNECACGDKANTAAHKDENTDGKCDVCAYNVGLPTTPDDGNKPSDNPQAGDNTQPGLWIALTLFFVCGLAVVLFLVTRKKGKNTR